MKVFDLDLYGAIVVTPAEEEVKRITALNEKTAEYNLVLTRKDAEEIVVFRREALKNAGRVEVESNLAVKIIDEFSDSPFIDQCSYKTAVNRLIELFYEFKNDTEELVNDNELIDFMKGAFNGECNGSFELLEGKALPEFARKIKRERGRSLFDNLAPTND